MIPEEKVREVAERLSIVDVVGEYLPLRRSGANYVGLCPFHGEKTPSFNVNPAREIFHCFGCGAGGDIFSFVMKIEGLSFPEAIRKLAARAGVTIEEHPPSEAERRLGRLREEQRTIMKLAVQRYRDILTRHPDGAAARSYLQEREVDPDTAAAYGIGCAAGRRDTLVQMLREKGCSLEAAAELGIIRKGERNWYDLLHSRLIFPIRDSQGQVIAFAGRVLDASLPKYINTPESPLYRKSSVLFGIDLALRDIRQERAAIVVEGYFDHLALYRAGIRNALATCGTALTDGHIALLRKHAEQVYLLFDGDAAGRSAAVKAMELCLEQKLPVYVISLPQGEDPDSFLRQQGAEAFRERVLAARPAFEQFLYWLLAKTPPDSIDRRVRLMDEIVPRFKRIADPVERNLYEKEICRLLGIDLPAFRKRLAGGRQEAGHRSRPLAGGHRQEGGRGEEAPPVPRDALQETLLGILASYPESRAEMTAVGLDQMFDRQHLPVARAILAEGAGEAGENAVEGGRLLARLENGEQKALAARLLMSGAHLADIDWRTALQQCLQRGRTAAVRELKQLSVRLGTLPPDSPEYTELLRKAEELRNRKSALQ